LKRSNPKCPNVLKTVIARCAKRAVAIQPLDRLGALSLSKRLDCFLRRSSSYGGHVVVPPGGPPRNDSLFVKGRWHNRGFFSRTLLGLAAFAFAAQLCAQEVRVHGLGWLENRAASQKLKLLLGGRTEETLDANAIEDAALVLISLLHEEGYLEPDLVVEITLADGTVAHHPLDARLEPPLPRPLAATAATLRVDKGRRFTLREIEFTGLLAMTEKEARSFFVGENTLIPLASGRIYSPSRLDSSAGNLEESLRQLGYAEATVIPEEPQVDSATGDVRATIAVREGPLWQVTALRFEVAGDSEGPVELAADRAELVWNTLWRQDTMTEIRRWYFARGHPDVQIKLSTETTPQADGTVGVTVTAHVIPGPEVRLGEVRFEGNTHTREATLRRLVSSGPGDLLNPIELNDSHVRISQLGVFRSTDMRYDPPDAPLRDVVYRLTEGRRLEMNLFAGYGSYEQLRGGVEWRHHNLTGRAHAGSLKLVQSMTSSQGAYVYTVPGLFGTRTNGSARMFGQRREELSFVSEEYGANLSLLWPLRRLGLSFTTGYTFKHVRDVNNELATGDAIPEEADIASLDLGAVFDRRDNPLRPRKGYKLNLQVESASRALGGEVDYQQVVFGASYHTAWGRSRWIHAGISQGVVLTLGGSDDSNLPVSVRFFPGGDGSIRGYKKGGAAPRDADGLFVGAKSYMQFTIELEQALTNKWSVVAFADALGTAARLRDYPFNEELYSVGLGLRYQTIIGPVRLEYGHNLNPRPLDPDGTVLFSIGFPF
jgi:outer membrane protein insertion porin family